MAKKTIRLSESQLRKMVAESVKKVLVENYVNEISTDVLRNAYEKTYDDMRHNNNDYGKYLKRQRQADTFAREINRREQEEQNSVCPQVPESELKNMPKDTYVIMDGTGRDWYGNFMYRYSGRAGTKEQCMAYVDKYFDKNADWEFLPNVVSLENYFELYARQKRG